MKMKNSEEKGRCFIPSSKLEKSYLQLLFASGKARSSHAISDILGFLRFGFLCPGWEAVSPSRILASWPLGRGLPLDQQRHHQPHVLGGRLNSIKKGTQKRTEKGTESQLAKNICMNFSDRVELQ